MGTLVAVQDDFNVYLIADNVLEETFGHTAQVTNHPVGSRSAPADHRIDEPFTVTLMLRVTESPFALGPDGPNPLLFNDKAGDIAPAPNAAVILALTAELGNRPRCIAFYRSLELFKKGEWEYISTGMGLYRPLVMTSLTYTVTTAMHVDFNITLQEIEYIEAQRVELPVLKVLKKAPETCPTVPTGDKAKTAISAAGSPGGAADAQDRTVMQAYAKYLTGTDTNPELLGALNTLFP